MGLFAEEWNPAPCFPTIPHGALVALDTETCDKRLLQRGPGWCFSDDTGGPVGYAMAWDGFRGYWPFAHYGTGGNLDKKACLGWLDEMFKTRSDITWVFANAMYDLGWLWKEGVSWPTGRLLDVQIMEPLLDEYRKSYSLESLGRSYMGQGKVDMGIDGGEIWRTPPNIVGPYAEQDTWLTLEVAKKQLVEIENQGLVQASLLEHDLIPVLFDMRRRGIRVDIDEAERRAKQLRIRMQEASSEIKHITGVSIDPWVAESCASALQQQGFEIPSTARGAVSITKDWLASLKNNRVAELILDLRRCDKVVGTYLEGQIMNFAVNGRVHAEMHSLRRDRDETGRSVQGTVSYRFSITNPGLQLLPGRDGEMTEIVRGAFLPEEDELFGSRDYSQQEPRMALGYASMYPIRTEADRIPSAKAKEEAAVLNADSEAWHFHKRAAGILGVDLGSVKTLSLGRMYGAGDARISEMLGYESDEETNRRTGRVYRKAHPDAIAKLEVYDQEFPWVRWMAERCAEKAENAGHITLLGGYRARFGRNRDYSHKAFNRLVQGSSAVQAKRAMVAAHREKVKLLAPVHDELCFSGREKEAEILGICMREAAKEIPITFKTSIKMGKNWGECK